MIDCESSKNCVNIPSTEQILLNKLLKSSNDKIKSDILSEEIKQKNQNKSSDLLQKNVFLNTKINPFNNLKVIYLCKL